MTLYIRPLRRDDAGALLAITEANREFWEPWIDWVKHVDSVEVAEAICQDYGDTLGAWDGLELVGLANVSYHYGCCVARSHVGTGIAQRLWDVAMGMLIERECRSGDSPPYTVNAMVKPENVRSVRYVQKLGFVPTGRATVHGDEYSRKVG